MLLFSSSVLLRKKLIQNPLFPWDLFKTPVFLRVVDEGSAQEVPHPLVGQLRVALVHMQLPPRTAVT